MEINRILFATDFSDASESAFHIAASLARECHATLVLLYASHREDYPVGEHINEDPTPPKTEVEKLESLAARAEGVNCECRWVHCEGAHEADVICRNATKEEADMLVVGTHGRTGLSHILMGSVAERVIRDAPCPVMCVRQTKQASVHA